MALWIGEVEDGPDGKAFDQIGMLMNRYLVHMAAIDALPETRLARQLQQIFWGRVFIVLPPVQLPSGTLTTPKANATDRDRASSGLVR